MRLARETKNTYLYEAALQDVAMRNLYSQKDHMPDDPPQTIIVVVTAETNDAGAWSQSKGGDEGDSTFSVSEMPLIIRVRMSFVRETKNTYRFDAISRDAAVRSVYVLKEFMPAGAPDAILVLVTDRPDMRHPKI